MSAYNVRLVNPWKMWFKRQEVMHEVSLLFEPAAKKAGYNGVNVTATLYQPQLLPADVQIYLVPNEGFSLLEKEFGEDVGDAAGRTVYDRGASEVYLAGEFVSQHGGGVFMRIDGISAGGTSFEFIHSPATIAKIIFHETLHNKLQLGSKLHTRKGPADALFRETLKGDHSKLSKEDTDLLASKLKAKVKQWEGGWKHLPQST